MSPLTGRTVQPLGMDWEQLFLQYTQENELLPLQGHFMLCENTETSYVSYGGYKSLVWVARLWIRLLKEAVESPSMNKALNNQLRL